MIKELLYWWLILFPKSVWQLIFYTIKNIRAGMSMEEAIALADRQVENNLKETFEKKFLQSVLEGIEKKSQQIMKYYQEGVSSTWLAWRLYQEMQENAPDFEMDIGEIRQAIENGYLDSYLARIVEEVFKEEPLRLK